MFALGVSDAIKYMVVPKQKVAIAVFQGGSQR